MTEKKIGLYGRILAEAEQLGKDAGHATGPSVPIVQAPKSESIADGFGRFDEVACPYCQAYPGQPCFEAGKDLEGVVHAGRYDRYRTQKREVIEQAEHEERLKWRGVVCPRCRAGSYQDCRDDLGRTVYGLIHDERKEWSENPKKDTLPYRRWPWADSVRRWGVFRRKSDGDPYKKCKHNFSTYDAAVDSAVGLENASKIDHPHEWSKQQRYVVYPMAWVSGDWVREDLAPNGGIPSLNPKSVECPHCKAPPGSPCKRPSGHTVFGGDFHADRKREVGA